ncbi:MAG: lysylphosphatidylglycerol synthase domain-containing protein [Opitutaceae bacterium]
MSRAVKGAALAGLAVGTGAVVWLGAGRIFGAIGRIGWMGLGWVLAWQLAMFVAQGLAWRIVCPEARLSVMVWGRLVREGGVTCLPFSGIGGLAFGARALMLGGVGFGRAAASTVIDVVAEGIGLAPFLVYGLVVLLAREPGSSLAAPMAAGIGALLLGGAAAFALRRRLAALLRAATALLLKKGFRTAAGRARELNCELEALFLRRGRITWASLAHVLCWCGGAGNVWIGYHLLGAKPGLAEAMAMESLFSGALSVGFMVPGGFGVQELAYIGVGRLFGMPSALSLALSLIRRARDLIVGAPALAAWQFLEARRLEASSASASARNRD